MNSWGKNRMKIVIDARMYQESGIGRYIRNLIDQLKLLDKENNYYVLLLAKDYDTLEYHSNFHKVLANVKWYGPSEQFKIPEILRNIKPDLVHFPHFNVPIFYRGKFVVTIHDLIHQHFQMRRTTLHDPLTYKIKQLGYAAVFNNALKKSLKILVPSNYIKDLLVNQWRVEQDKVVVTYEAVDDKLLAIANKMSRERINKVMKKFHTISPYIFYVGNAHPHKNVEGLIKAFLKLKKKYPQLNLVLAGYDHYFWQRLKGEYRSHGLIYTGYVNDEELVALYKAADCFVMPSFEEGFGIPLLEAMACSCSIVSSSAGALPEVGGDAALYFDPQNTVDMVSKIDMVLKSAKLREGLIVKGEKRFTLFSWRSLAEQTLKVYEETIL